MSLCKQGKKHPAPPPPSDSESEVDSDAEAEAAALAQINLEKEQAAGTAVAKPAGVYNKVRPSVRRPHTQAPCSRLVPPSQTALLQKLSEIEDELDYTETLTTCKFELDELDDTHDDLQREVAFYNLALATVKHGEHTLKEMNEPYRRPDDYFAEMLKTDKHMTKIKDKLIFEQRKISAFEERKNMQDSKKMAKQVEAERLKQRKEEKEQNIQSVKKWQKDRLGKTKKDGGVIQDDDGFEKLMLKPDRQKSKKREAADNKWGFGGRKKILKQNDRASFNDDSAWNEGHNRAGVGKNIKGKGGKGGKGEKGGKGGKGESNGRGGGKGGGSFKGNRKTSH